MSGHDDHPAVPILYDGACPACRALRDGLGDLPGADWCDARGAESLVARAAAAGLDPDRGMVVFAGGETLHGAAALAWVLRRSGRGAGIVLAGLLERPRLGEALYGLLAAGRGALLRLLGRPRLRAPTAALLDRRTFALAVLALSAWPRAQAEAGNCDDRCERRRQRRREIKEDQADWTPREKREWREDRRERRKDRERYRRGREIREEIFEFFW